MTSHVVSRAIMHTDPYHLNPIKCTWRKAGWVKIRPVAEEYGDKTYLGIYIGDVAQGFTTAYNPETEELMIGFSSFNPGIFVPALGKVIYGHSSWWGMLKTPEDLKDISDVDINDVWYMQALKALAEESPDEAGN